MNDIQLGTPMTKIYIVWLRVDKKQKEKNFETVLSNTDGMIYWKKLLPLTSAGEPEG